MIKNLYQIFSEQIEKVHILNEQMFEKRVHSTPHQRALKETEKMTELLTEYQEILSRILVNKRKEIKFYDKHRWQKTVNFFRE